jgi:phosphate transport system protein
MSPFWEYRLLDIREQLLMMSVLTERSFDQSIRGFQNRNDKLCEAVEADDSRIDALEMQIDEMVVTFMATHAPTACDARMMLALTKIASNLERVADEATKIARRSRELNAQPLLKVPTDISAMAETARDMLHDSISALVDGNPDKSVEIVARDRSVDALKRETERELIGHMLGNPKVVPRALNFLTVVRAVERVADHAKNIAEEVYFLSKAENIRHKSPTSGGREESDTKQNQEPPK